MSYVTLLVMHERYFDSPKESKLVKKFSCCWQQSAPRHRNIYESWSMHWFSFDSACEWNGGALPFAADSFQPDHYRYSPLPATSGALLGSKALNDTGHDFLRCVIAAMREANVYSGVGFCWMLAHGSKLKSSQKKIGIKVTRVSSNRSEDTEMTIRPQTLVLFRLDPTI